MVVDQFSNTVLKPPYRVTLQLAFDDRLDGLSDVPGQLKAKIALFLEPATHAVFYFRRGLFKRAVVSDGLIEVFPIRPHLRETLDAGAWVTQKA